VKNSGKGNPGQVGTLARRFSNFFFAMLVSLILWRWSLFITVVSHPETLTG
jgi:hypothetical protein